MDWITFTSSIIVAAVSGAAASLLAPWSQWGVEKRRLREQARRELVRSWYELIEDYKNNNVSIVDHKNYATLRQHLTSKVITSLEVKDSKNSITIEIGKRGISADRDLRAIIGEIRRIEKEWKLV